MPQVIVVAKGNRISDLEVTDCPTPIGYKLYTGPVGEETAEASYCGTRQAEYLFKDYTNLRKTKKLSIDCGNGWDCWQLTAETQVGEDVCAPE